MAALFFGNPAVRTRVLTRGFASQPHDWFAFVGRVEASLYKSRATRASS